jgi:hypothetical protein
MSARLAEILGFRMFLKRREAEIRRAQELPKRDLSSRRGCLLAFGGKRG